MDKFSHLSNRMLRRMSQTFPTKKTLLDQEKLKSRNKKKTREKAIFIVE